MNTLSKITGIVCLILYVVFATNCSNKLEEDVQPIPSTEVLIENAKLTDFTFSELDYSNIEIKHPEITAGVETKPGEIKITIPFSSSTMELSLKKVNFDSDKFDIFPGIGVKRLFSDTDPVIYTITSKQNPKVVIRYKVFVIKGSAPPQPEKLEITGFKFEKSKNPGLPGDIEAARIETELGFKRIFIFVPSGTDFANLTPTIAFKGEGAKLYYSQDPTSSIGVTGTEYPEAGLAVDFKYPKRFFLAVKNTSSVSQTYEVIADVKNPIKFDINPISTSNIAKNETFFGTVGTYTNQGNHELTSFGATYKNQNPTLGGSNIGRISLEIPGTGLKPGESSNINFSLNKTLSSQLFAGAYKFTSVHPPGFSMILSWPPDAAELLDPSELEVTVNLVD